MFLTFGYSYALHGINANARAWFSGVSVAGPTITGTWSNVIHAHAGGRLEIEAGGRLEAHA